MAASQSQLTSIASQDDPDILRIMITTDNHLGVWERDEWRGNDSFEAFAEVLDAAKRYNSDLVLLGGDLFHDNKPSRSTVIKCLDILNRSCIGDRPVAFQVLSSPGLIESGVDQTQDPHLNVGLPVFTIHGNHDDPSGPENLSAVDVLSTVHYVNYFGKHTFGKDEAGDTGKIRLSPLLLQKHNTKVAIYGLGFMREERLARSFQEPGQVVWLRPSEDPDAWMSIFVLHQNRVQHYKQGPNNKARNIRPDFLPEWLDFVVWGHEHECIRTPDKLARGFSVLQPGSTVATSLSEPESKPKHCFLLELKEDEFRTDPIPLRTIRPFKFGQVSLRELRAEPGNHKQIEEILAATVADMIEECLEEHKRAPADDLTHPLGPGDEAGGDTPEKLPLIRLRVDYTGYSTIHAQRFGHRFVGKVANPTDILLFSKTAERKAADSKSKAPMGVMPADLDNTQIEDLVAQLAGDLEILPAEELGEALKRFVEKEEKTSIAEAFNKSLSATQAAAMVDLTQQEEAETQAEAAAGGGEGLHSVPQTEQAMALHFSDTVSKAGKKLQADARVKYADGAAQAAARLQAEADADAEAEAEVDAEAGPSGTAARSAKATPSTSRAGASAGRGGRGGRGGGAAKATAKGGRGAKGKAAAPRGNMTLEGLLQPSQATAKTAPRKKAANGRTGLKASGLDSDEEDEIESGSDTSMDENASEGEPERAAPAKRAPAPAKRRKTRASVPKAAPAPAPAVPAGLEDSDSDDVMFVSESQAPAANGAAARGRTSNAR